MVGTSITLVEKKPAKLLEEIRVQANSAGMKLHAVQFVGAEESMDSAKQDTKASLWQLDESGTFTQSERANLSVVNEEARLLDQKIADLIEEEQIDGLIVMSGDPNDTNQHVIRAAAKKQVPVVGTGGTSMATIATLGARVIATSGTTGTTNRTRLFRLLLL